MDCCPLSGGGWVSWICWCEYEKMVAGGRVGFKEDGGSDQAVARCYGESKSLDMDKERGRYMVGVKVKCAD